MSTNNGDADETVSKRGRPSPKDESKIDSTSEFEPYVPSPRRNPVELLLNRPQAIVSHFRLCCADFLLTNFSNLLLSGRTTAVNYEHFTVTKIAKHRGIGKDVRFPWGWYYGFRYRKESTEFRSQSNHLESRSIKVEKIGRNRCRSCNDPVRCR